MGLFNFLRRREDTPIANPTEVVNDVLLKAMLKGEKIDKLLHGNYSTLSLGYAGLYECVKAMTGKSHTDPEATPFAIEVQ